MSFILLLTHYMLFCVHRVSADSIAPLMTHYVV